MLESHLFLGAISQAVTSKTYRRWIEAVYKWADTRKVDVLPANCGGEWCAKITLRDSKGPFFNLVYQLNVKKAETDEDYEDRVASELDRECAQLRRERIELIAGRAPAARAA